MKARGSSGSLPSSQWRTLWARRTTWETMSRHRDSCSGAGAHRPSSSNGTPAQPAMCHGVSVITPRTRTWYLAARSSTRSTALKSVPSQRKTLPIAKSIRRYLSPASDAARNRASC